MKSEKERSQNNVEGTRLGNADIQIFWGDMILNFKIISKMEKTEGNNGASEPLATGPEQNCKKLRKIRHTVLFQ